MMNQMLTELGKNLLTDNGEYESVIRKQNETLVKFFAYRIVDKLDLSGDYSEDTENYRALARLIYEDIFKSEYILKFYKGMITYKEFNEIWKKIIEQINNEIDKYDMKIRSLWYVDIVKNYFQEMKTILDSDIGIENFFLDSLAESIKDNIIPF